MQREATDTSDVSTPEAVPAIAITPDANIDGLSLENQHTAHGKLGHGQDETGPNSTAGKQDDIRADGRKFRDFCCCSCADDAKNADSTLQDDTTTTTCKHEQAINTLMSQRDDFEKDLTRVQQKLDATRRDNNALHRQVRDLRLQLSEGNPQLKAQVASLRAEKRTLEAGLNEAHHSGLMDGLRSQCAQNERVILVQQVEAYKNEAAKWKQEALGKGSEAISTCWQASVDEAVRRKRESDLLAIKTLQEENAALRAEEKRESDQ